MLCRKEVCNLGGRTSAASKNKYIAKAYDRINLTIPKGRKQAVEAFAESRGEKVNGLINELLRREMGLSVDEWKAREWEE